MNSLDLLMANQTAMGKYSTDNRQASLLILMQI